MRLLDHWGKIASAIGATAAAVALAWPYLWAPRYEVEEVRAEAITLRSALSGHVDEYQDVKQILEKTTEIVDRHDRDLEEVRRQRKRQRLLEFCERRSIPVEECEVLVEDED